LENSGYEINPTAKEFYESHKKANIKAFVKPEGFQSVFEQYSPPEINYSKEELEKIASESDLAIITIGRNSGEGGDRVEANDFSLKSLEKKILQMTCEVFHEKGKKVIVVLNIGGVIETASWKDQPDAILLAWQGGQEGGNSITDILNGNINPSGKIPMTFPINVNDHASHKNFPLDGKAIDVMDIFINRDIPDSKKIANEDYTNYEEGIYVGYRHFDKDKLEVSYPFGYGLSYTAFNYSAITTEIDRTNLIINLSVNNIGHLAGKEVVQVYVSKNESEIDRPIKELKGFLKTSSIKPNRSEVISIKIPLKNLTYWDETNSKWVLEKGTYTLHIGNSSRDIKISQNIVL
ncbi:MAG: glycoside hydrolase family 3 C-terminal domain-containing protein, partial [Flavobacteriales bacterium]